MPCVSVIVPTFNRADFLKEALESVFAQSYEDFELIVVDDGSNDNTQTVVRSLGNEINYIYQENKGVSAARNLGLKRAGGNLIALLDSDDLWEPKNLRPR